MSNLRVNIDKQIINYSDSSSVYLNDISFSIASNESLAIIGQSGSGKTLIAKTIMGVLKSNIATKAGEIFINDVNLLKLSSKQLRDYRGNQIIYIPQSFQEYLNPSQKIYKDFVEIFKKTKLIKKDQYKIEIEKRFNMVNLSAEILEMYPYQISGGMAQKLALALSYNKNAEIVIADEPTNGLDSNAAKQYVNELFSIYKDKILIIITHDIELAKSTDNTLILLNGNIVEYGSSNEILTNPKHPYTKSLIDAQIQNGCKASFKLRDSIGNCPYVTNCINYNNNCLDSINKYTGENNHYWRCNNACCK